MECSDERKEWKPEARQAPASGQYPVIGPRGGNTGKEVTVPKGRPLPPTDRPGKTYGKPDLTKNKSGTGSK
ncbi:Uncharacterised protein [Mycobacteroides abscessus]|nr:Uncharacterised protein [Mycobacteroides abscessus]